MRYVVLAGVLALAIVFDLGVLIETPDDTFRAVDPERPATLAPIVSGRFSELPSRLRFHVGELLDAVTATYRAWIRHETAASAEPQEM